MKPALRNSRCQNQIGMQVLGGNAGRLNYIALRHSGRNLVRRRDAYVVIERHRELHGDLVPRLDHGGGAQQRQHLTRV